MLIWETHLAWRTETAKVSFSFTIGITPILRSSVNVFCAFRYCVRYCFLSRPYTLSISHSLRTSAMSFLVRSIWATGCRRWANRLSQRLINVLFSTGIVDELSTCILGRYFGLLSISIFRSPTAMAPEETMTTRCPSLMRATAVSTIRERIDKRGSCVFSWTIELEPVKGAWLATVSQYAPCLAYPVWSQWWDVCGPSCLPVWCIYHLAIAWMSRYERSTKLGAVWIYRFGRLNV